MLKRIVITAMVAICGLFAQNGETWNTSETVYQVSTIDLEPNADAQYLNQMKRPWGTNMKILKADGLIEDYHIYKSVNEYDGDYDLLLVVKYKNLASLDSNPKRNKDWDKAIEKARKIISQEQVNQITGTFPKMRTILDQKLMREITFIK